MESVASGSRDDAFHTIHTMGGWSGGPDDEPIEGGETASGRVVVEGGAPTLVKACAGMEVRSGPSSDRRRPRGRRPGPPRETRGKRPNPGPNLGFFSSLFHGRITVRMATIRRRDDS